MSDFTALSNTSNQNMMMLGPASMGVMRGSGAGGNLNRGNGGGAVRVQRNQKISIVIS